MERVLIRRSEYFTDKARDAMSARSAFPSQREHVSLTAERVELTQTPDKIVTVSVKCDEISDSSDARYTFAASI